MKHLQIHSPNLLILSDEGPNLSSAGGILLYRLLEDYPNDRLRVIERNADPNRGLLSCRYDSLVTPWRRFEQSRFNRWKRSLRGFGLVPPVRLRKIKALLNGFKPDVVLCVMQHAAYYEAACRYARMRGVPLIVIVHDVNESFEPVLPFALSAVRGRDADFYRYAKFRLCVSPQMEALCSELYGVRGEVLYPNRGHEIGPRPFEANARLKVPGQLTVGFVGNLNYGYGDALLRMLPAFRSTGSRLVIFSHPPGRSCVALLDAKDCYEFRGFVPSREAWRAIQSDCDAVILPYPNPAGSLERLYRYHFPSKLPEYLALGMPVIVTGPTYAAGVAWALEHPRAVASYSAADVSGVRCLLSRLRDNPDFRINLARAGFTEGELDFSPLKIKSQFFTRLHEAAASHHRSSHRIWHLTRSN